MLNKKILATAVAVAFSSSALAGIDLTNLTNDQVGVASEALVAADFNGDGLVVMNSAVADGDVTAPGYLDVISKLGFTIGNGTSKYVRIDLTAAEFESAPALALEAAQVANATVSLSQGGLGQNFVIFEVAATANIPAETKFIVETEDLAVNPAGVSSITIATYDTASDAVNKTGALYSDSEGLTLVGNAVTGVITKKLTSVATVGSNFLAFDAPSNGDQISTTVGRVGVLDASGYVRAGYVDNDGASIDETDLLTTSQAVAVEGDFTFGSWKLDADANCGTAGVTLTVNEAKNKATTTATDVLTAPLYVCVTVPAPTATNAKPIKKGTYSLEILEDEIEGELGGIEYNTVSINVPYVTTFSAYNQRLYIVNNGNQDALYTMSFTSEDGTTVVAGSKASGTVPAGEMIALKATDVVTLSGKTTRVSAVIEIEAEDDDISAASQSVNTSTGGTDTVVLND